MIRKTRNLAASFITLAVLTGCGSNTVNSQFAQFSNANQQVNSLSVEFASSVEADEIMIDEEFYRQFPDKKLANQLFSGLQAGYVPQLPDDFASGDDYQAQSFLDFLNKKAKIDIYDSYGTPEKIVVYGRVYKKKSITPPQTGDGKFTNIIRNIKYFIPNPIDNTQISVSASGVSRTVKTDKKGYFMATFDNNGLQPGVRDLSAKLMDSKYKFDIPKEEVVVDSFNSDKFAIVTDVDDTVKYTGVDNKLKMVQKILTGNYKTDKGYPGVSELYRGLLKDSGTGFDCMHYLTGSPVHLYDRIQNFLKLNNFPQGSLTMKRLGSKVAPTSSDTYTYKVASVREMIKSYPNKKFVFFGDTTQSDADAYQTIKKEFPQNVAAIYINNVTNESQSNPRFQNVLLTKSAIDAAQDLFKRGIISQTTLDSVTRAVKY